MAAGVEEVENLQGGAHDFKNGIGNMRGKIIRWANTHNLNWLISFHNDVRGLLKSKLKDLKGANAEDIDSRRQTDALHDYDRILHINTFLMMYSHLEEWLYHYKRAYVPHVKLDNKGGSLGRFKHAAEEVGTDLSLQLWSDLKKAEDLRNCLLHANGRISLSKEPQKVKAIISKNSGLSIKNDRVAISGGYLQRFNENIGKLFDTMDKNVAQGTKSGDKK